MGLQCCATCALLFSVLYEGRCAACAARWAALTGTPSPVAVVQVEQEGPKRRKPATHRVCRACEQLVASELIPDRYTVAKRVRGWCRDCVESDRKNRRMRIEGNRRKRPANPRPHDPAGRTCRACHVFQAWTEYYPADHGLNGRESKCRTCYRKKRTEAKQDGASASR